MPDREYVTMLLQDYKELVKRSEELARIEEYRKMQKEQINTASYYFWLGEDTDED